MAAAMQPVRGQKITPDQPIPLDRFPGIRGAGRRHSTTGTFRRADETAVKREAHSIRRFQEFGEFAFLGMDGGRQEKNKAAEETANSPDRIDHSIGIALYAVAFFVLPFELVYTQRHLNTLWQTVRTSSDERPYQENYAPEPQFASEF